MFSSWPSSLIFAFVLALIVSLFQGQTVLAQPPPPPPPKGPGPPPPKGPLPPPPPPPPPPGPTPAPVTMAPTVNPFAINCDRTDTSIQAFLSVDVLGDPYSITDSHLLTLADGFQSTYDFLGRHNCDKLYRRVSSVEIQLYNVPTQTTSTVLPVTFTMIYRVTFTCRGDSCAGPAVLFSQKDGFLGRGDGGGPGDGPGGPNGPDVPPPPGDGPPPEGSDVCGLCTTDMPTGRSASPRQFVSAYRRALEQSTTLTTDIVQSVINVLEVETQSCSSTVGSFGSTMELELDGTPDDTSEEDRQLLAENFRSSYNYFSGVNCDGRYIKISDVHINNDATVVTRRLSTDGSDPESNEIDPSGQRRRLLTYYYTGWITGSCRGCNGDYSLSDDGIARKLEQTSPTPAPTASPVTSPPTRAPVGTIIFSSSTCFCARQDPELSSQQVRLNDSFNTLVEEERADGRLPGVTGFREVRFP